VADEPESIPCDRLLLGGRFAPIGCTAAFLESAVGAVLAELEAHRGSNGLEVTGPMMIEDALGELDPMEAPWTTHLVVDCGAWTCYLNNGLAGGDPTAAAPALADRLETKCVTALHTPRYGPGHASTQLWIQGPGGEGPLMHLRTLAAHCEDGRWSWHESGKLQPFETPSRYKVRLVRNRLDRTLLVSYLSALEIDVDDPTFFGDAWAIREIVAWPTRRVPVQEWRNENGWDC